MMGTQARRREDRCRSFRQCTAYLLFGTALGCLTVMCYASRISVPCLIAEGVSATHQNLDRRRLSQLQPGTALRLVLEQIEEMPSSDVASLERRMAVRGVVVFHGTVWFLRREGRSFKKTLFAIEQQRPDV